MSNPLFADAKPAAKTLDILSGPTQGFKPGEMQVIVAGTNTGKSSLPAINLTRDQVLNYGTAVMAKSAQVSESVLQATSAGDGDQFIGKLNDLVVLAKGFNPNGESKGFFGKVKNALGVAKERLVSQYRSIDQQCTTLLGELKIHSDRQAGRMQTLGQMANENTASYHELEDLVNEGKAILAAHKEETAPTDPMEAQAFAERQGIMQRFEKRVNDLDSARTLTLTTAVEIRGMQENAAGLIDKFSTLSTLTIPLLKKQFGLYVMQLEQKKSAEAADKIDNLTNQAMIENANMLHDNTLVITKANQRAVVDMATIEHVQNQLIATVEDVRKLTTEAHEARKQSTAKLADLRQNLVKSISGKDIPHGSN